MNSIKVGSVGASANALSRSVIPESAETTINVGPSRNRARATAAMFAQRARVDTLVPPNFSTMKAFIRSIIVIVATQYKRILGRRTRDGRDGPGIQ